MHLARRSKLTWFRVKGLNGLSAANELPLVARSNVYFGDCVDKLKLIS